MTFDLQFYYDGIIPAVGLTLLAGLLKRKVLAGLNFAEYMDQQGIPVHYLAAEDNERRLKSGIEAVFKKGVMHLNYHAVMSSERPLPRGSEALP